MPKHLDTPSRGTDRLTAKAVDGWLKQARAGRAATKKLFDGQGLFLTLTKAGTPVWRLKYRLANAKSDTALAIGVYPSVGLAAARAARDAAKAQLRDGRNPVKARQVERARVASAAATSFGETAATWLEKQRGEWTFAHHAIVCRAFARDISPGLGPLPIAEITSPMVAAVIMPISERGAVESAKKMLWHITRVFSYAKALGLVASNPAVDVAELLPRKRERSQRPALLELDALRDVLRRSDLAPLSPAVRLALRVCAFTASRAGNVVAAEWSEFHLDDEVPTWIIPRAKMKRKDDRSHDHRIVLAPMLAEELRVWRRMTESSRFVFPSAAPTRKHLTVEALDRAYARTLKLAGKHSPHGWRAAYRTICLETGGFSRDALEIQLDHVSSSEIIRAYDRGERFSERIRVAHWWEQQLTSPPKDSGVLPMRRKQS